MSDVKIALPRREVRREQFGAKLYFVWELKDAKSQEWHTVSKGYPHSTSAYAKLGRLTQHDTLAIN